MEAATGHPHKTMDRQDLFQPLGAQVRAELDTLIRDMYARNAYMTSWYGTVPYSTSLIQKLKNFLSYARRGFDSQIGRNNRGKDYEPLPGAGDDDRLPWYLYWEIAHVMQFGPRLAPGMKALDAGGTGSLFTSYLASKGVEVHSIDLNPDLVAIGNDIAQKMGFNMKSYSMDMTKIQFPAESFDHAYSICVFEHLELQQRHRALAEIHRILRPGGRLSITFDYRNPRPFLATRGMCTDQEHLILTQGDIERSFLSSGHFELEPGAPFHDNGKNYLVNSTCKDTPYTFGSVILRKR